MGKIVKYCNSCEEGFAEKFGFCPNCGASLTAFEMQPVIGEEPKVEPPKAVTPAVETPKVVAPTTETPKIETPKVEKKIKNVTYFQPKPINDPKTVAPTEEFTFASENKDIPVTNDAFVDETVPEIQEFSQNNPDETIEANETVEEPKIARKAIFPTPVKATEANPDKEIYNATYQTAPTAFNSSAKVNDGYGITIVEEKNVKQRNLLLLGSLSFLTILTLSSWVYSMYNKYLFVGAIDSPTLLAYVGEVEPVKIEEVEVKKDKEKGGGGGGGGREEETPASKGRTAAQSPNPIVAPDVNMVKMTNPTLQIQAQTKNKNPRAAEDSNEPYGLTTGGDKLSNGMGKGRGQGDGRGNGQGNGIGDGVGNGIGDGRGNGNGDGEGNGKGGGNNNDPFNNAKVAKKDPVPVGPTIGVKIISKPRPSYTDSARQTNIQGTVLLKVTFLANGSIGGVSAVKGLGGGLTEQAIAAAKRISFEPAKRGGVPYSVTKTIEYSFNIY